MSRGHALENLESLVPTLWQLTTMQSGHNIVKISADALLKTQKYDGSIFTATSQMTSTNHFIYRFPCFYMVKCHLTSCG